MPKMQARPGLNGSVAAVRATIHAYIYGVTSGRKKNRAVALPGSYHADFFRAYGPTRIIRVAYIYGVNTRTACKYIVQKRPDRRGSCTGPGSLTSAGGPVLKICKCLPKAAGTATFGADFTYR